MKLYARQESPKDSENLIKKVYMFVLSFVCIRELFTHVETSPALGEVQQILMYARRSGPYSFSW